MMNVFTGSILQLNDKEAIVITQSCDFVSIQRRPDMFVGQQVKFKKSDLYRANKNYMRYFALAASMFIIALFSVFYYQIFIPNTVFAYVDVDINPSIEFVINKNAKVLEVKSLNNDAQTLLKDLSLIDIPIKEAISIVVKKSKQMGYISTNTGNAVLISASIDDEKTITQNASKQETLDSILSEIGTFTFDVGTENIKPDILKVTPENRKTAVNNDISMGRYELYSEIKKENNEITVQKAKTERVSDMIDKAKIKRPNKNKTDESKNNFLKENDLKDDTLMQKNFKNNFPTQVDPKTNFSKQHDSENDDSKQNNTKNKDPKQNDHKKKDSEFNNSKRKDSTISNSNDTDSEIVNSKSDKYNKDKIEDSKIDRYKENNSKAETKNYHN